MIHHIGSVIVVGGIIAAFLLPASCNPISPKKLLLSKWTAVTPMSKEKHFVVTQVVEPQPPAFVV